MNTRQGWILVLGIGVTVSVLAFGTSRPLSPSIVPPVEHAPGQYSREVADVVLPKWILITALGSAVLTGASLYWTRTTRKTP